MLDLLNIPVINIHPALPGQYDGGHAIWRAYADLKAGKLSNDTTGVMIHHVITEVDMGEFILVNELQVVEGESLEALGVVS